MVFLFYQKVTGTPNQIRLPDVEQHVASLLTGVRKNI
jgi:hypothetical protein